jgi:hypothetical protein
VSDPGLAEFQPLPLGLKARIWGQQISRETTSWSPALMRKEGKTIQTNYNSLLITFEN